MASLSLARLPTEIVCLIAHFTLQESVKPSRGRHLNAWARTCRYFCTILTPILYRYSLRKTPPGESCVFWAARVGRLETIKVAAAHGAHLGESGTILDDRSPAPIGYGTALHLAIRFEHLDIAEYLLENGANVHPPSYGLCDCCRVRFVMVYPLHLAMNHAPEIDRHRFRPFVELLAKHGAIFMSKGAKAPYELALRGYHDIVERMLPYTDPDMIRDLLHLAIRQGRIENLPRILACPQAHVLSQTSDGDTALHLAVSSEQPGILKLLLEQSGAYVGKQNESGNTPLHDATGYYSNADCAKMLLNRPGNKVNEANGIGHTPLSSAALQGHTEIVELLLKYPGIDVNAVGNGGRTALYWAVRSGVDETFELLFTHPEIDVNKSGRNGRTPLHVAAAACNRKILDRLLAHPNIDVDVYMEDGCTILHMVASGDNRSQGMKIETIDYLLHYGLPINKVSKTAGTVLTVACSEGDYNVALYLLSRGADPLIKAHNDGTQNLLLNICLWDHGGESQEQLAKELLSRGVPFDEQMIDLDGYNIPHDHRGTPLFYAAAFVQSPALVRLLLDAGANPNSKVLDGERNRELLILPAILRHFQSRGDATDDHALGRLRVITEMLVKGGSYIGDSEFGYSALQFACTEKDAAGISSCELLELLLRNASAAQVEYEHIRWLIIGQEY
ncbi:unnamed protein product [Clonostachys rosea]|uniref:F-box domain-containing protein n=1 Tax=Bionectria ochroleuca TaxID=29856 RepID=A0ABY6U1N5_BIOOC|nr:unnamed protein product [Clonostachys rosea]